MKEYELKKGVYVKEVKAEDSNEIGNIFVYDPKTKKLTYKLMKGFDDEKNIIIKELKEEMAKLNKMGMEVKILIGPKSISFNTDGTEYKDLERKKKINSIFNSIKNAPPEDLFSKPFVHKKIVDNNLNLNQKHVIIDKSLRNYQKEATDYALKHKHCIIELPTGRGKTLTAISIVKEIMKKHPAKVLVLVPTTILLSQWIDNGFKESQLEASGFYAKAKTWSQFTVSTYQSAIRHLENIPQFDVIIFDEVHHLFAPRFVDILKILFKNGADNKYLIGLTATVRTVGDGLFVQDKYFPNKFTITMSHFQNSESKIPVKILKEGVKLDEEDTMEYQRTAKTIAFATQKMGSIVNWVKFVNSDIDEISRIARAGISAYSAQKKLLSVNKEKTDKIEKIIRENEGQFIVFNDTIGGMILLKRQLNLHGIKSEVINANVSMDKRREILKNIKNKKIQVLIGGNAISEGLDLPDISNIILSSLIVKSTRSYVQRLGRVMRPIPGKSVKCFIIYCKDTIEQENAKLVYDILGEKYEK